MTDVSSQVETLIERLFSAIVVVGLSKHFVSLICKDFGTVVVKDL